MQIISDLKKIQNAGLLIAAGDVTLLLEGYEVVVDFKVFASEKGRWTKPGQETYMKEGIRKYKDVIKFPNRLRKEIDTAIFAQVDGL